MEALRKTMEAVADARQQNEKQDEVKLGASASTADAYVRYWFTVLATRIKTTDGIIGQIKNVFSDINGDLDKIKAHQKEVGKLSDDIDQKINSIKDFPEAVAVMKKEGDAVDAAWKQLDELDRKFRQLLLNVQNAR